MADGILGALRKATQIPGNYYRQAMVPAAKAVVNVPVRFAKEALPAAANFIAPKTTASLSDLNTKTPLQQVQTGAALPFRAAQEVLLQYPARLTTSMGVAVANEITGKKTPLQPKSKISKALLGEGPVRPTQQALSDYTKIGDSLITEQLKKRGTDPNSASGVVQRLGLGVLPAALLGGSLEAASFDFGLGGVKNKLAKEALEAEAKRLGRNLAKNEIDTVVGKVAKEVVEDVPTGPVSEPRSRTPISEKPPATLAQEPKMPEGPMAPFNVKKYVDEQEAAREAARKGESKGILEWLKAKRLAAKSTLVDAQTALKTPLDEFDRAGSAKILPTQDIRLQLPEVKQASVKARNFLEREGFADALRHVDNIKEFKQFLLAKHSVDVTAHGIETGRNVVSDNQLINALSPKYEVAAAKYNAFSQKALDKLVEYKLISPELSSTLKARYPNYVPLDRVFSELEHSANVGTGRSIASLSKQGIIKNLEGSTRAIEDPLKTVVERTNKMFAEGERNKAAHMLAKYAALPGNPFGIKALRVAKNVVERIKLLREAKELRIVRDKIERLLSTRGQWVAQLQREIRQFEKGGLKASLKKKADKALPTKTSGLLEKGRKKTLETSYAIPSRKELRGFVEQLVVERNPEVEAFMRKIATREPKIAATVNEIRSFATTYEHIVGALDETKDMVAKLADESWKNKNTFSTVTDGIRSVYEASPEVVAAAKSLTPNQIGLLEKALLAMNRVVKMGITGTLAPVFAAGNLIRDTGSSLVTSKSVMDTHLNPLNWLKALWDVTGHGKNFERLSSPFTSFDLVRDQIPATLEKIVASSSLKRRVMYIGRHPIKATGDLWRTIEDILARPEEFTRQRQAIGTEKYYLRQGRSEKDALTLARDAYRRGSVDFSEQGTLGNTLRAINPYLPSAIQGTRTNLRALRERPFAVLAKVALAQFLPVTAATYYNLSDPKRKEFYENHVDARDKENFLIVILPWASYDEKTNVSDGVLKIPLIPGFNKLVTPVRKGIEESFGFDPVGSADIAQALLGFASPVDISFQSKEAFARGIVNTVTPQPIKPALEVLANQGFYFGNKLVPDRMKNLSPNKQVKPNTSGTARKIGELLGVSPIKVEHLIKGYLGGEGGGHILRAADTGLAATGVIPKEQIGGEGIISGLKKKFFQSYGGAGDPKVSGELDALVTKRSDRKEDLKIAAEKKFEEIKNSTASPAEKNAMIAEIKKTNPKLFEKVLEVGTDYKLGLSYDEKRMKYELGVEDGSRARFIYDQTKKLKTPEEKNAYLTDLKRKKVLTDKMIPQLKALAAREKTGQ